MSDFAEGLLCFFLTCFGLVQNELTQVDGDLMQLWDVFVFIFLVVYERLT